MTAAMPKVFVSDTILQERLAIRPARSNQGQAPWGWKALSALYQASLAACGYQITPIVRPEIYQTDIARRVLGVEPGDWHLAVKPIEHLRPFHGIPNVFVCDWPFPEFSTAPLGDSPFFDQARLLRMADAVVCCTDFTTETLRRAGIEQAITLPPYSPSPPAEGAVPFRTGTRRRFLSVVDIGHLSRQLGPTIAGFAEAARQQDGLSLVICVQGADTLVLADLRQRVAQAITAAEADETISILGGGVDGAAGLYAAADFFLCADAAPGLPLPLVRAMQAGLPIVTTMTAGMASVLPPEAAVPIATGTGSLEREGEPIARFLSLTTRPPTAATLCDAVLAAAALGDDSRFRMAAIGMETAERRFGLAAFQSSMGQLGALALLGTP
jgi:glycosyltransferase involved in cell wall biosynthesis